MTAIINPVTIFLPMLVVVALTFVAFVRMAVARGAAVKAGQDPAYYRAHIGSPEPEATRAAVRHYGNLLELPTLLYAACLTAFALGEVSQAMLVFAWGFAIARTVQSAIHLTTNTPGHRGLAFVAGVVCLLLLWIDVGWVIFSMLGSGLQAGGHA